VQAKAIHHLIDRLLPEAMIIIFADYDPVGLKIACTTLKSTHLLIPQLTPELMLLILKFLCFCFAWKFNGKIQINI